jgi:hypothetical protein
MGVLRRLNGTESRALLNQHLIGRGPECALRLTGGFVSAQHALIRWQGRAWEVVDRGSRNGTRLDGEALEPGHPYRLNKGARLVFGHADQTWVLEDAAEPDIVALALEDGRGHSGRLGLVGLPSSEAPECTLFREPDGSWKIELADGSARPLEDGETFEAGGQRFRFYLPGLIEATANLAETSGPVTLHFEVSSDEEFVELALESPRSRVALGSRAHNYLLLTLARAYRADQEAGVAPSACGWRDKEDLAKGLGLTPEQVDGEVFRVRKHFARHGLVEANQVIERRARTKQIRLGLASFRIDRV